ncbi:fibrous sheath-interacting protein 2-like [Lepisosteus oculatus]|uniref:fibrous sheath-interacting protein 2-like n=2 Tax=Lepisosteus oculatus TaxID=7918 RepID=UPI0035F510EF
MERKKPGSGAGCYTMLYALQGEQQLLERPVGTKLPLIPGSKPQFCRTALSEKLHQPSPDFTLTDPHGFLLDSKYNSLHDPHLRTYYHRKGMQESLQNRGLINEQKKVLCSLKEYNQYHNYLSNVKLQYDKNYVTKQKTIVKKFLELQEQNEIPRDISFTDVREWLLEEGSKNISDQFMANRDRHQAGALKTEEICRQAEMWKIRERALHMRIEEDARREVRQAQLKNQTRARRHKKAFEYYKRKVALQQQKLNESLQERKDFEREMQDRIKRQYFNEILQSGKQASTEIISTENRDVIIANEKSSKITKEVTTDSKWFHEVPLISQLSDGERKVIEKSLYGQITTEELNEMAENIVVWVAASIIRVLLPAISLYSEERSRSVSHCSFESPVYFSSSEEATLSSHSLLVQEKKQGKIHPALNPEHPRRRLWLLMEEKMLESPSQNL